MHFLKQHKEACKRGFTLVELLIGMTIAAMLGTGVYMIMLQTLKHSVRNAIYGDINNDQRIFKTKMAQEAKDCSHFVIYPSFSDRSTVIENYTDTSTISTGNFIAFFYKTPDRTAYDRYICYYIGNTTAENVKMQRMGSSQLVEWGALFEYEKVFNAPIADFATVLAELPSVSDIAKINSRELIPFVSPSSIENGNYRFGKHNRMFFPFRSSSCVRIDGIFYNTGNRDNINSLSRVSNLVRGQQLVFSIFPRQ